MADNPFPLDIAEKQDSWEKTQLMSAVPDSYKYGAAQFNLILKALNYLYELVTGSSPANTNPWLFIEGSLVLKGDGNTNTAALENGDKVQWKEITNTGEIPAPAVIPYGTLIDVNNKNNSSGYQLPAILS